MEGWGTVVVGDSVVLICGVRLRVGIGLRWGMWWYCGGKWWGLGMRLVFVGKPACSHVFHSGVVWIECLVFEHCPLELSCPVSP